MSIGENIKKYRKEFKLTQKELAEKIDKKDRTIQKYEKGDIVPPLPVVKQIAAALDTSISNIIGDDDNLNWQAIKAGYTEDIDTFYKSPSDVILEKKNDSIDKDIDTLMLNEYLQNDLNYKYNEFTMYEKIEVEYFIYNQIKIKINEIITRRKLNK